jgi:hypothetical protein
MKTKLLVDLLVLAIVVAVIASLAFLLQAASPQVAQGHPPANSPGCEKWPHGPIVCVPEDLIPVQTIYNAGAPGCTKPPFPRVCQPSAPER